MILGRQRERGFTLLEVMVAMAILGVSLVVIFDTNSRGVFMIGWAKQVTVATQLARYQMTEIEAEIFDEGFDAAPESYNGDFCDQGWCNFKYEGKVQKVELNLGGLAGGALGGSAADDGAQTQTDAMQAGIMGMFLPMIEPKLEQALRRITLTISWSDGPRTKESFTIDQFVVNLEDAEGAADQAGSIVPNLSGLTGGGGQNPQGGNAGNNNRNPGRPTR